MSSYKIAIQQCGIMYVVIVLRNVLSKTFIILDIFQRGNMCQRKLAETILSPVELFGLEIFLPTFYFEKFQT